MALQQLLLLLSCLSRLGCVGSAQLTAADQAGLSGDLVPRLAVALRSAALALWLCKTPAASPCAADVADARASTSAVASGTGGPPLALGRSSTAHGATVTAGGLLRTEGGHLQQVLPAAAAAAAMPPCWSRPLAAHLLPLFWRQQGGMPAAAGAALPLLGGELACWLVLGGGADAAATAAAAGGGEAAAAAAAYAATTAGLGAGSGNGGSVTTAAAAVTSSSGLAARATLLAYQLFLAREHGAMARAASLVGGSDPSEPGLQFALGLALACGPRSGSRLGGGSDATLDAAVGHMFRAAAGLGGQDAAPLRLALALLRARQGGAAGAAGPLLHDSGSDGAAGRGGGGAGDGSNHGDGYDQDMTDASDGDGRRQALLRLGFCQTVMVLFEQEGATEGALAFARAALGAAAGCPYTPDQAGQRLSVTGAWWRQHQHCTRLYLAVMHPLPWLATSHTDTTRSTARLSPGSLPTSTDLPCTCCCYCCCKHAAALWGAVFDLALELGHISDAYVAALANPIPERAAECVRRLVQTLLDGGRSATLLELPWAGTLSLTRGGVTEPVPVVEVSGRL